MRRYWKSMIVGLLIATVVMVAAALDAPRRAARAIGPSKMLVSGTVVVTASHYGDRVAAFISRLRTANNFISVSKVVPIYSVGQRNFVGTAQVTGTAAQVRTVRAVAAIDLHTDTVAGTGLVPVSAPRPNAQDLPRVEGVGIAAIIDYRP